MRRAIDEFLRKDQGVKAREFTGPNYKPRGIDEGLAAKINQQITHLTLKRTTHVAQKIGNTDREKILRQLSFNLAAFAEELVSPWRELWEQHPLSRRFQ